MALPFSKSATGFAVIALGLSGWWILDQNSAENRSRARLHQLMSSNALPASLVQSELESLAPGMRARVMVDIINRESSPLAERWERIRVRVSQVIKAKPPDLTKRPRTIQNAIATLARYPMAKEAVPVLTRLYERGGAMLGLRSRIASALMAAGPAATNAVPVLMKGLHPTNAFQHRSMAASALVRIDPTGDWSAVALGNLEKQPGWKGIGSLIASNAVAELALPSARWTALEILGSLRPEADPIVAAVAPICRDDNERYRAKAAEALGRLGPGARVAGSELKALLEDDWLMVRAAATNTLRLVTGTSP